MEIQVFKRRFSPEGKYLFSANNLVWAGKEESVLKTPNSQWWVQVNDKETILELVSFTKDAVEKVFPKGKHIEFVFEREERKIIQIPFDEHTLATAEDLSNDEFEEFLKTCSFVFEGWKG